MNTLQGKVAIVTGGGQGIGAAICELFCQNGIKVVIAEIDEEAGLEEKTTLKKKVLKLYLLTQT